MTGAAGKSTVTGAEAAGPSPVGSGDADPAALYRGIALIRRFEERAIELVNSGEIVGGIHPYIGQEAIAVGVCAVLRPDDVITSTHRGHGHVLAKGADPARMLAELCGRVDGLNHGRGGSMHAADFRLNIYGANGIVGAGAPIATGAAWARRGLRPCGDMTVAVSFFGDGALNQGVLLETLNLAVLWSVPVLFVCENNGYATSLSVADGVAGSAAGRAAAFGIPFQRVDGQDVAAVHSAAASAIAGIRAGGGPAFLECVTYRFDAHHTWEHKARVRYRDPSEVAAGRERDPREIAAAALTPEERSRIDADVERVLDVAVAFARASAQPEISGALDHLYATGPHSRSGVGERVL